MLLLIFPLAEEGDFAFVAVDEAADVFVVGEHDEDGGGHGKELVTDVVLRIENKYNQYRECYTCSDRAQ